MKLAISNIAWPFEEEPAILEILRERGADGVEVAPSKIWPNWEGAGVAAAARYRKALADQGFAIPALQAILFGKPELKIFEPASHPALVAHMTLVADIAQAFGARTLVFGSPKNRRRDDKSYQDAWPMAVDIFGRLGEVCAQRGVVIGLEPNPIEYGCDFITNLADAERLAQEVRSPGVAVHIDEAALSMTGDVAAQIETLALRPTHYHASEPMLVPLGQGDFDHAAGIRALRKIAYTDWVSIEMRQAERYPDAIRTALTTIRGLIDHV